MFLGSNPRFASYAVAQDLICGKAGKFGYQIPLTALADFNKTYMLIGEVIEQLGVDLNRARHQLRTWNVGSILADPKTRLWLRSEFETNVSRSLA